MVYLAKKNGAVVAHTDLEEMKRVDGIAKADKIISDSEFEEAGGLVRIINNKIVVGKTDAEAATESAVKGATAELVEIQTEIARRDYRALKAQKLGNTIDALYPGETDWYKAQLARMTVLEEIISDNGAE
jgi:hypothetical protein